MARIHRCEGYREMSREAAALIISALAAKGDSLLCAATGSSPESLYQELAREARKTPTLFQRLRVVKLDEWLGVTASNPASCEYFLKRRLLDPLSIAPERYIGFNPETADAQRECGRVLAALERHGPIDLCILGLGKNGHVGFNEPGSSLLPHCHVAKLSEETLRHAMLSSTEVKPTHGMTLGIADVLAARKIVLLITGEGKEQVTAKFLDGGVTTEVPATFLWLHHDVEVFLDASEAQ